MTFYLFECLCDLFQILVISVLSQEKKKKKELAPFIEENMKYFSFASFCHMGLDSPAISIFKMADTNHFFSTLIYFSSNSFLPS